MNNYKLYYYAIFWIDYAGIIVLNAYNNQLKTQIVSYLVLFTLYCIILNEFFIKKLKKSIISQPYIFFECQKVLSHIVLLLWLLLL